MRRLLARFAKPQATATKWLFAALTLAAFSCAPSDNSAPSGDPSSARSDIAPSEDFVSSARTGEKPAPVSIPEGHKARIDTVLKHIQSRELRTDNGFWTIFHGILGVGPDNAMLTDTTTGKKIKAIDYIAEGNYVRGMTFIPTSDGLDVRTEPGSGVAQGHQDQFIAEMTQWGLPKDKKFIVKGTAYTFNDFIRHARARARVTDNQELSWAVLIVGQFYGPDYRWTNSAGEKICVEDMVDYELKQPIADSPVCGGTHRLFGITWVYHLHRAQGGKKDGVWKRAADTIAEYIDRAHRYQNPDGSFSTSYLEGPGNVPDSQLRLASTGHVLEWLSLAMSDQELRQPWVEKAADELALMILRNADQALDGGALYHAAHGLHLYRARLWGAADSHGPLLPPPPKD
jgi:hypothetical protein